MTLRYEVERGFLDKMHLYLQRQPLRDAVGFTARAIMMLETPLNIKTLYHTKHLLTLPWRPQNYPSPLTLVDAVDSTNLSSKARTWLTRLVFSSRVEIISTLKS